MQERLELQAIGLPSGDWRFVLRDALGREVAASGITGEKALLTTGHLPAGWYEWSLWDGNREMRRGAVLK
jgi:hypothetical protein